MQWCTGAGQLGQTIVDGQSSSGEAGGRLCSVGVDGPGQGMCACIMHIRNVQETPEKKETRYTGLHSVIVLPHQSEVKTCLNESLAWRCSHVLCYQVK